MSTAARSDDGAPPPSRPVDPPWTPEELHQIRGFVTAGLPIPVACTAAGVKWTTAKHWLAKGRRGQAPWTAFAEAMDQAKAMHEAAARVAIAKHMARDWRAAAWVADSIEKRRERAQAARDAGAAAGSGGLGETTVIMYPVPVPEGADIATLPALPPHALERTVGIEADDEEHDDEWNDDD